MKMIKENYTPWQLTQLTRSQFTELNSHEKLLFLCRLGHLAPSSHNSQPWRFFIDANNSVIEIYLDKKFVLPISDVVGRQAIISIGCAVENMVIGASYLNAIPNIQILSIKNNLVLPLIDQNNLKKRYIHLARFHYTIKSSPLPLGNLYKSIFSRKVTRAEFNPQKPLAPSVIHQLESVTDGKKTKLHLITDGIRRLSISEFQGQADGFVINSPRFSKELGAWLLPNNTDSSLGMPGAGFGLSDDEAIRIHEGLIGRSKLQPEDNLKFALAGKIAIEKSPFIGCITVPKDDVSYWFEAGRSFERMFLTLESLGMSVAIHAGIVEVPLINRIFGAALGTFRKPAVLFRAGMVRYEKDKSRPHSPRLSIEDVLLTELPYS